VTRSAPGREAEDAQSLGKLEVAPVQAEPRAETPAEGRGLSHEAVPPISDPKPSAQAGTARGQEPPALASASGTTGPNKNEAGLRERIQRALLRNKDLSYTAQRVRVEVDAGDVTLRGEVRTLREKREVEALIQQISGVRRIHNTLAVIDQPRDPLPSAP
jgi:hypothetical protein